MTAASAGPSRREGGFTLIEILVGALVLGIFISFVYGAVVSAFRVRSVVQSTTTALANGTMVVEIVARDLENAFWRPASDFDAFKGEDEGGDRARVDFLTTTDSRTQQEIEKRMLRSDVTEVGYRTRQGDAGLVLFRREQFGVDEKPLEGGDWFKVIGGVREFKVEWYAEDPSKDGGDESQAALKEWNTADKKALPRAAKITLVLEAPSTDPEKADTTREFPFTRWVVLPGADDTPDAKEQPAQGR